MADLLAELGFNEVDTAQKKPEFMNELNTGPYDLLVKDLKMPDMNGLDLSNMIKKEAQDTKMIIMVKGSDQPCPQVIASALRKDGGEALTGGCRETGIPTATKVVDSESS